MSCELILEERIYKCDDGTVIRYRLYEQEGVLTLIDPDGREFAESFSRAAWIQDKTVLKTTFNNLLAHAGRKERIF